MQGDLRCRDRAAWLRCHLKWDLIVMWVGALVGGKPGKMSGLVADELCLAVVCLRDRWKSDVVERAVQNDTFLPGFSIVALVFDSLGAVPGKGPLDFGTTAIVCLSRVWWNWTQTCPGQRHPCLVECSRR